MRRVGSNQQTINMGLDFSYFHGKKWLKFLITWRISTYIVLILKDTSFFSTYRFVNFSQTPSHSAQGIAMWCSVPWNGWDYCVPRTISECISWTTFGTCKLKGFPTNPGFTGFFFFFCPVNKKMPRFFAHKSILHLFWASFSMNSKFVWISLKLWRPIGRVWW